MARKFRVSLHGTTGTWYCIQQQKMFFWVTVAKYIDSYDEAKQYIENMKDSEK